LSLFPNENLVHWARTPAPPGPGRDAPAPNRPGWVDWFFGFWSFLYLDPASSTLHFLPENSPGRNLHARADALATPGEGSGPKACVLPTCRPEFCVRMVRGNWIGSVMVGPLALKNFLGRCPGPSLARLAATQAGMDRAVGAGSFPHPGLSVCIHG